MREPIPTWVVAAPASGSGKTVVTMALASALQRRGTKVSVLKAGPDYLDPGYHAAVTRNACRNLDGWMLGKNGVQATFERATRDADIALVEGVMGLFDGRQATSLSGSTAELARWLRAPVLLVVDASAMARSAAAVVEGFASHVRGVQLGGVVFNRVGSLGHAQLLREALSASRRSREIRCFGSLPRDDRMGFASRHLGLHSVDAREVGRRKKSLAALAERHLDVDGLLEGAGRVVLAAAASRSRQGTVAARTRRAHRVRIGIARDEAFHFYYEDNLDLLRENGAELIELSPLRDRALPRGLRGLILGGGYPEEHAAALAANASMRAAIARFAKRGVPVYGECGGLMYLGRSLRDREGTEHAMSGVLPLRTVMLERRVTLGYREVETTRDSLLGPAGTRFRGHEFHWSKLRGRTSARRIYRWEGSRSSGEEGYAQGHVLASYIHAHWGSNPHIPQRFVQACRDVAEAPTGEVE